MRFLLFSVLLLGLVGVLLATQTENFAPAYLYLPFLPTRIASSLFWFITGSVALGLVVGYLAAVPGQFGAARRARKAERELAARRSAAGPGPAVQGGVIGNPNADETQRLADEVARRTRGA
ncbi:MAG: hypothetical protein ACK41D_09720 [Rubricoccaceae bacterium]